MSSLGRITLTGRNHPRSTLDRPWYRFPPPFPLTVFPGLSFSEISLPEKRGYLSFLLIVET